MGRSSPLLRWLSPRPDMIARKEKTISGSPPFHNTLDIAHTTFVATGGANWFSLGWKSRAASPAAGYPLDCSDQVAAAKERYGTQAWVDVTGTMSSSSTAKCLEARKSYDSVSKKVTQLRRACARPRPTRPRPRSARD